jgi:ribosomal protein S25
VQVNASAAREGLKYLLAKNLIREVSKHGRQCIYTCAK